MIEKNHSHHDIYFHDLKNNLPKQQSGALIKKAGGRVGLVILAVATCSAMVLHLNHDSGTSGESAIAPLNASNMSETVKVAASDSARIDSGPFNGGASTLATDRTAIREPGFYRNAHAAEAELANLVPLPDSGPRRDLFKMTSNPVNSPALDARYYPKAPEAKWESMLIAKGDSLSGIFNRLGLPPEDAVALASGKNAKSLNYLNVGNRLGVKISNDNEFSGLTYQINRIKTLQIEKLSSGEIVSSIEELQPKTRIRDVTAPIQHNLSTTADRLNIPKRIISKLSGVFRWDIDFARDIKPGDRFSLIYEEQYIEGQPVITGDILAAEFIINGKSTRAIRHLDPSGHAHYYTPEGKSLRKAFMRNPVKYAKVTSGFSKRRYHPVLKKWRAHKGVDYGASRGAPIMATADGVISHIGRKGAYGKAIVINHGKTYSTLYGHMKGFRKGLKNGTRVKQGQIIGYVGSTGLATGPHLHYEFRIDGVHVDPLAIKLPKSLPIDSRELDEFIAASQKWVRRLDDLQGQSIAKLETRTPPSI